MRIRALLVSLALASLACNTLFPPSQAAPTDAFPSTATPRPVVEATVASEAVATLPPTTTAEAGLPTPEPPPAGVRACDYDPLLSVPVEMPAEVAVPATPTPFVVQQPANTPVDAATTRRQLDLFHELVDIINDEYIYIDLVSDIWPALVEKYEALISAGLTDEDFYLALDSLIFELGDEHSNFEDPQEVIELDAELSGNNNFVGVGILLQSLPEANRAVVILTFPGGSAVEGGIKAHDAVLAVDGQPIVDADGELRADLVRGPEGTDVTLTIQTPGQAPYDITLERRRISAATPVDYCLVPRTRIGYIYLPTLFDETIPGQMRGALEALTSSGPLDGLILDNRQNGGGISTVVEDVLALFTSGVQGHFVNRDDRRPLEIDGTEIGNSQSVPLVVLVELETASFGEIMSGVLQNSGRAQVVGSTTLGNVEVLWGYDFDDGSRAWIAHDTFEPNGLDLGVWEETGIVPDVTVPTRWDLFTEATDPTFPAALQLLAEQGAAVPDGP
jgi:carboxyl-terminal processing protease